MGTVETTDATFEQVVLRSEKPVLVDFWATWCAPCRAVAPILESLSDEFAESLTVAKVDTDANPAVSGALKIRSIPTLILFENGKATHTIQGALPKDRLVQKLREWLPNLQGPSLSVDGLHAAMVSKAPVQVFDVRRPQDFERSHLRGARCVPTDDLAAEISRLPSDTLIVVVCRTGEESQAAVSTLQPPHTVKWLEKGLLEWEGSGKATYSTKEERALEDESTSVDAKS